MQGVPRNLPLDCYDKTWWATLSPFEQETVSTVKAIDLAKVANNLEIHCHGKPLTTGGTAATGNSTQSNGKARLAICSADNAPSVPSGSGPAPEETMQVDLE